MNDPTPPQTTPAAPAPTPAPQVQVQPHSKSGLSESEAATMSEWVEQDLASGKITSEQATTMFTELGRTLEPREPDTRTPEQKTLDQQFPAAKPDEYLIRYGEPGQPYPSMTPELKQFDTTARAWLAGAEFPDFLGNSLITQIERTVHATKGMTPEQLESYGMVEYDKLARAYGETLDEQLRAAAVMIDAVDKKHPGLKDLLKSKGIGDNALVVAQILGQSERWHARRKGR